MKLEETIGIITKGKVAMIDVETGEFLGTRRILKEDDMNFHKVWIAPFANMLSSLSKKQLKVMFQILQSTRLKSNVFKGNVNRLAKICQVSTYTVEDVLRFLLKNDFARKIDNLNYMINPKVMYYGTDNKKLIRTYNGWTQKGDFGKYGEYKWQKVWIENLIRCSHYIVPKDDKNKAKDKDNAEKNNSDDTPKIDNISGVQMKILFCLISNMRYSNNTVIISQRDIVEKTGVCLKTVNVTIQLLKNNNCVLYDIKGGPVMINPEITAKCNAEERQLLNYIFQEKKVNLTPFIE